jgi:ribonuclease T2
MKSAMKWIAFFAGTLLTVLLAFGKPWAQSGVDLGPQPPGQFDFYVLSLTWVPSFCAAHPDPAECVRNLGFGLHGLWPESVNGYPSNCSPDALPIGVRTAYAGLFPSADMIDHEWSKHGTCSGLGASGFFARTQRLLGSVAVPPQYQRRMELQPSDAAMVKGAFLAVNPALNAGSLVLSCTERRISEMHICLRKDGSARTCEAWERSEDNCR